MIIIMNIVNTVTAYDLSALPFIENRWYRVGSSISTYQFYLDTTDAQGNHLRSPMQVTILATDNLRQFATEDGYYYVASLNVIYLRSASEWTRITDTYADKPAATLYDDDGARTDIVDVIDNNGLLKNGSVVIRDSNRVVKAILSVDNNGDIQIKPYLGGGLRLCDNQSGSMLLKNGQVTYDKIIAPGGTSNFSGSYNDLTDKPTISSRTWEVVFSTTIETNLATFDQTGIDLTPYCEAYLRIEFPEMAVRTTGQSITPLGFAGLRDKNVGSTSYRYLYEVYAILDGMGNQIMNFQHLGPMSGAVANVVTTGSGTFEPLESRLNLVFEVPAGTTISIRGRK